MPVALGLGAAAEVIAALIEAVMITAAALLTAAVLIWLLEHVRGFVAAANIPLVGSAVLSGIDGLMTLVRGWTGQLESWVLGGIQAFANDWVKLIRITLEPNILPLMQRMGDVLGWIEFTGQRAVGQVADLEGWVASSGQPAVAALPSLAAGVAVAEAGVADVKGWVNLRGDPELARLRAQVADLEGWVNAVGAPQLAALDRRLLGLEPFYPLLVGLGAFEGGAAQTLRGLRGAQTAVEGRLGDLERYKALLALLAVLGALTASQVVELARTARCVDVCERLGLVDDLNSRVEAIEAGGF